MLYAFLGRVFYITGLRKSMDPPEREKALHPIIDYRVASRQNHPFHKLADKVYLYNRPK